MFFIHKQKGFSLLEMIVAMLILGISLGGLYQAVGNSTRSVAMDEKYAYAVELASSLLADNSLVPSVGLSLQDETGDGFSWSVLASPISLESSTLAEGAMQEITVSVSWRDGSKRRQVVLSSVVPGLEL